MSTGIYGVDGPYIESHTREYSPFGGLGQTLSLPRHQSSPATHRLHMAHLVGSIVSIEWLHRKKRQFFDGRIVKYDQVLDEHLVQFFADNEEVWWVLHYIPWHASHIHTPLGSETGRASRAICRYNIDKCEQSGILRWPLPQSSQREIAWLTQGHRMESGLAPLPKHVPPSRSF